MLFDSHWPHLNKRVFMMVIIPITVVTMPVALMVVVPIFIIPIVVPSILVGLDW